MKVELVNLEAERSVLKILWEETTACGATRGKELLAEVALAREDFSADKYKELFCAIRNAVQAGLVPTLNRTPGAAELLEGDEIVSPVALGAHATTARSLSTRRTIARIATQLHRDATETELTEAEIVARAETAIRSIPTRGDNWQPMTETMGRIREHMDKIRKGGTSSVATGWLAIDMETGGLPPTLVVIAAMPGVGKSAFEASILRNMAQRGERAAVFCMEDRSEWLGFRLHAHESGVHQFILRNKQLVLSQWTQVRAVWEAIAGFGGRILCDDRPSLTPAEVLFAARAAIRQHGARAIFLDNMTAMRFCRGPRMDLEIQDFLVGARAMADELQVPFVVLSHVKRRDDLGIGDMPRLTDCSETSAFEKLSRLAYGLCRDRKSDTLTVGVLKNTNGRAHEKFELELRPSSALIEAEQQRAAEQVDLLECADDAA